MAEDVDPAGLAAFASAVCAVTAVACNRPEQWGLRRMALGAGVCCASVAGYMLLPAALWLSGGVWGLYQGYLGWSYVSRRRRTSHERVEFVESSAAVLAYVALADGHLGPREVRIIHDTYAKAGFAAADLRDVERIVRECQQQFRGKGSEPDRLFVLLKSACEVVQRYSNEQTRFAFIRAAITISASDGYIAAEEERALSAVASWLSVSKQDYDRLWRSVLDPGVGEAGGAGNEGPSGAEGDGSSSSTEDGSAAPVDLATYYASILGISLTASPQEVKQAYRQKAKRYHPDVVAHRGPMFAHEAEERFKVISEAYSFFRGGAAAM